MSQTAEVLEFDDLARQVVVRHRGPMRRRARDEAIEKYHAIEGGQQTLSNLAAYVAETLRKGAES